MLDYALKLPRIQLRYKDEGSDIEPPKFVLKSSVTKPDWPLNRIIPPPTRFRTHDSSPPLSPCPTVLDLPYKPPPPYCPPTIIPPPTRFKNLIPDEAELIDRIMNRKHTPPGRKSMLLTSPGRDHLANAVYRPPPSRVYIPPPPRPVNISDLLLDLERGVEDGPTGRYRRRRSSPLRFGIDCERPPLSARLLWYAKHANIREAIVKEKQRQAGNKPVEKVMSQEFDQELEGYDFEEEARQKRLMETIANLPKLPKFEMPRPNVPGERGDGFAFNVGPPRRKLVMTRLEKVAAKFGGQPQVSQAGVPPHELRRRPGQDPGPMPMAPRLPRDLMKAPMRFRPMFKKPVKPPVALVRKNPTLNLAQGNGTKPGPKKLPDHLRYGNFKMRKPNERPNPIVLPPFRFSTKPRYY